MNRILIILLSVFLFSCSKVEYNFSDIIKNKSADYVIQLIKENRIRYVLRRENLFFVSFGEQEENLFLYVCPYYGYRFYYLEKSVIESANKCGTDVETLMFIIRICIDYHIEQIRDTTSGFRFELYEKDSYKKEYVYQLKHIPNYVYEKGNCIEYLNENWCLIKQKTD